jgi:hypothetical protein
MSDTTNRSSINEVLPAATSAEAMAITSAVLGFIALEQSNILQFVLGFDFGDSFGRLFLGYIIIAIIAVGAGILSLTKAGAAWTRGVAGAGILMTLLAVLIVILGKLFS